MSWKLGSTIMDNIIEALKDRIDDEAVREEVYATLIEVFMENDCENLDECYGIDSAFDSALDDASFDLDDELDEEHIFDEDEDDDNMEVDDNDDDENIP